MLCVQTCESVFFRTIYTLCIVYIFWQWLSSPRVLRPALGGWSLEPCRHVSSGTQRTADNTRHSARPVTSIWHCTWSNWFSFSSHGGLKRDIPHVRWIQHRVRYDSRVLEHMIRDQNTLDIIYFFLPSFSSLLLFDCFPQSVSFCIQFLSSF